MPTPARYEHSATTVGTKGYVIGGDAGRIQDCDEFDASGNSWVSKTDIPSPGRRDLGASCIGTKAYIYAGNASSPAVLQDCDEFDPSGNTWTSKSDMPTPARNYPLGYTLE